MTSTHDLVRVLLYLQLLLVGQVTSAAVYDDFGSLEADARQYLATRNAAETLLSQDVTGANWNYDSNLTDNNLRIMEEAEQRAATFSRQQWQLFQAQGWPGKWPNIQDQDLKRQMEGYSIQGQSALTQDKLTELQGLVTQMTSTYSTAKVHLCTELDGQDVCDLNLEPDLTQLLSQKRDYDLLSQAWTGWRDVSGKQVRDKFKRYVELTNEAAVLNNYTDAGEEWLDPYEDPTFKDEIEQLWQEMKPLYQQLHAYVRRKLREVYGEDKVGKRGPIPAHLLGNMWAQSWDGINDIVVPYPDKPSVDVTETMKQQGYTPLKMFQLSDEFFTNLNLTSMPSEFWDKSIIVKPPNTDLICHASAWDFHKYEDVRIKMCTDVTMEDLFTIHHEMGHVEYYLQYRDQPFPYRTGANPGFHEAVGDSLALSVRTPKHLHKIGLLDSVVDDDEADINMLLNVALSKVVFLPFGYMIDQYRWDVFSGDIAPDRLNCGWWDKRFELQGLKPPVKRTEEDFDPGAKYHVVSSVPYIRYFVSFVVQFQFHKAMCLKAGEYDPSSPALPLHRCDVDRSKEAGDALASMLKLGASRPWLDALEALTGTRKMDSSVLREYFRPLEVWLKADNELHGEYIGWEKDGDYCS